MEINIKKKENLHPPQRLPMEYVAYGAVAVGAIVTLTVFSTDYLSNYFSSPLVVALRSLGSAAGTTTTTLNQHSFYVVVDALKETTSGACTALPSPSDPTSLGGQHDETAIVETILSTEKFDPADPTFLTMLPQLQKIVHGLCLEATACANFEELRQVSFDNNNALHQDMLESLWEQLCPGVSREPEVAALARAGSLDDAAKTIATRKSKSWGRIGFQGLDPVTDLRGMGLLGLLHLVHFARTRHSRTVLEWSQAPVNGPEVKFFPFACASIQITNFVLQLARERLLGHVMILGMERDAHLSGVRVADVSADTAERRMKQLVAEVCGGTGMMLLPSDLVWQSMTVLNDIHTEIFILLGEEWQRVNPPDVMSFPSIMKQVEKNVREALMVGGDGGGSLKIRWRE